MSDDGSDDTVASKRRTASVDDTVASRRRRDRSRPAAVQPDAVSRWVDAQTDDTVVGSRSPGAASLRDLDAPSPSKHSVKRFAYEPDAELLRAPAGPRAAPPALVRPPAPSAGARPPAAQTGVDSGSVERATRTRARNRVTWLVVGCIVVAAGAAALLLLLML